MMVGGSLTLETTAEEEHGNCGTVVVTLLVDAGIHPNGTTE